MGPTIRGRRSADTTVLAAHRAAWRAAALLALAVVIAAGLPGVASAEPPETRTAPVAGTSASASSTLIILDASGSMNADAGSGASRLDAAKEALSEVLGSLPAGQDVGLRVFGHRVDNSDRLAGCEDTELVAPVAPLDRERLLAQVDDLQARGLTPIGRSLLAAADDLPQSGRRSVLLISDGVDECAPPDPCEVARGLAAEQLELAVNAIGFDVDDRARSALECIAEATGGQYQDAGAEDLASAFRAYIPQGAPVAGGSGPETAFPLSGGLYTDVIGPGEERWYSVDVAGGQTLSSALTVPSQLDTGSSSTVLDFGLRADDVLGPLQCAVDRREDVRSITVHLAIDGREAVDGAQLCAQPGRRLLRVALGGRTIDLAEQGNRLRYELLVTLGAGADPGTVAVPSAAAAPLAGPRAPVQGRGAARISLPVVLAGVVLGGLVGQRTARSRLR